MGRKCYVSTCSNTYRKTKNVCVIDERTCTLTTITYHSFPRDPDVRAKWIKATGRINFVPVKGSSYICSEHFKESDFDLELKRNYLLNSETPQPSRRVLKRTAIPTQDLGSLIVAGESEVYLKEEHYGSSVGDTSDVSQPDVAGLEINSNNYYSMPFTCKIEPGLENSHQETTNLLTSHLTIKEESIDSDINNRIFEPEIADELRSHSFESRWKQDEGLESPRAKRLKYEDNTIFPLTVKTERPSTPVENNINIEDKYEKLLGQYLSLKAEYGMLKSKYEKQREALCECERILKKCW